MILFNLFGITYAIDLFADLAFNEKIYRQTFGTPIGSPLSPVLADIVLQNIEERAISRISISIPFYFKYVDDILLAAPPLFHINILDIFNSFHLGCSSLLKLAETITLIFSMFQLR